MVTSGRGAVFRVLSLTSDTSDIPRESSLQPGPPLLQCRGLRVTDPRGQTGVSAGVESSWLVTS